MDKIDPVTKAVLDEVRRQRNKLMDECAALKAELAIAKRDLASAMEDGARLQQSFLAYKAEQSSLPLENGHQQ